MKAAKCKSTIRIQPCRPQQCVFSNTNACPLRFAWKYHFSSLTLWVEQLWTKCCSGVQCLLFGGNQFKISFVSSGKSYLISNIFIYCEETFRNIKLLEVKNNILKPTAITKWRAELAAGEKAVGPVLCSSGHFLSFLLWEVTVKSVEANLFTNEFYYAIY